MKTIVHDDKTGFIASIAESLPNTNIISENNNTFEHCIGCFSCWIKTPGKCILPDEYSGFGQELGQSRELIIISSLYYGGQSPFPKGILDCSIPYMLPYFKIRKKEMHHKDRYKQRLEYKMYFYGTLVTQEEKNIAKKLVQAQALNLNAIHYEVKFFENIEDIKGVL